MACSCSAFPLLTADEFERACRVLVDRACTCTTAQGEGGWSSTRLVTQDVTSIKIARQIEIQSNTTAKNMNLQEAETSEASEALTLEDEDPHTKGYRSANTSPQEAVIRTSGKPSLHIDYDIVLSPTYQVPVLYFTIREANQGPVGLDTVYQYVVPELYRKEVKSVGVMGGISFGYHPVSGAPAFFVHPCNTADAMGHIADAQSVTPVTYLLIWLGLVGPCVSLHIPRELVLPQDGTRPS
ncbi:Atg10p [Penicillium argentinense]|uniref:Ubiquitin-like-conjugating enzyme ATG10 n=1 Tax=Penicillium argentinense TaxID=1131581 RepID=A0A9W9EPU7_9EURO|nr:Atg10p [Penicillium argentinense]KAJ5085646.1 Atg10p [Penicillium argentinense]